MWGDYNKIKNPPRYKTVVLDSDKEEPEEISLGSITTMESPRNNFEAGRAPVQDTATERSVFLNDARIQLPTVKTLSLTTKVSPVGCNSLIRKSPKKYFLYIFLQKNCLLKFLPTKLFSKKFSLMKLSSIFSVFERLLRLRILLIL